MNDKYRKALLLIISIFIVVLITLGVSYAYMKTNVSGPAVTGLEAKSCAKISLIDSESTVINLDNTYPMSDNRGRQTEPYRFKVSSFCDDYVGFNLYFLFPYNELQTNNIKYLITDVDTGKDVAFGLISDLDPDSIDEFTDNEIIELQQIITTADYDVFGVFNDFLPYKGEKEYDLRLWVDENVDSTTMNQSQEVMMILKSFSREATFAEYVINTYDEDSNLYYHDENLENGAGDNSYRYAGSDPNNYVCFGSDAVTCPDDNLYRIIGVFDEQIKLIKSDYATSDLLGTDGEYAVVISAANDNYYKGSLTKISKYYWSNNLNNEWNQSELNTINLNTNFLNNIGSNWTYFIDESSWNISDVSSASLAESNAYTAYNSEMASIVGFVDAFVGLMYASDYYYAADPEYWVLPGHNTVTSNDYRAATDENWIYMGVDEYVLSINSDEDMTYHISKNGSMFIADLDSTLAVRPTFYLLQTTKYASGSGTSSEPYRIS